MRSGYVTLRFQRMGRIFKRRCWIGRERTACWAVAMAEIKLYQKVSLTKDLPEYNLRRGDVAVVIENLPATAASNGEEGFALEVFNAVGETLDVVFVPASAVKPLTEDEILQARPLSRSK